jgi:hypothetical protein
MNNSCTVQGIKEKHIPIMIGKPPVRPGHKWEDNITTNVEEIQWERTECIETYNNKLQHMVTKILVPV